MKAVLFIAGWAVASGVGTCIKDIKYPPEWTRAVMVAGFVSMICGIVKLPPRLT